MSEAPVKELYRGRADGVRGDEGSGGFIRTAAGYRPLTTSPAVARIPPPAEGPPVRDARRGRSTAVGAAPPWAQHVVGSRRSGSGPGIPWCGAGRGW